MLFSASASVKRMDPGSATSCAKLQKMDRGRPRRDNLFGFGDPFAGFPGMMNPGNLVSSFFGGRDPFDDPFFTQPFGPMTSPSLFGQNTVGRRGNPFGDSPFSFFLEDQQPPPKRSRGLIIEELPSDKEEQDQNPRNPNLGNGSIIKNPYEEREHNVASSSNPRTRSFSFQSSTVTYGGPGGAYYTSSTTRRTGGDGVTVEESRTADTTTRKASHRISRGLQDKGHSVTRNLHSDGRVDTVQTLHNINEGELPGFEEAWMDDARRHLPGWEEGLSMPHDGYRVEHSGSRPRFLPAAKTPDRSGLRLTAENGGSHMTQLMMPSSHKKLLRSPHKKWTRSGEGN